MLATATTTAEVLDAIQQIERTLNRDGFACVHQITTEPDVARIRWSIDNLIAHRTGKEDHKTFHDLGDDSHAKGSQAQSPEINRISALLPDLTRSLFYQNALHLSRLVLGPDAEFLFDHCIIKPAGSRTVTEWHQDIAYASRYSRIGGRLHWWLPLQAVDVSNSCMQYVRGSHLGPLLRHQRRSPKAWSKFAKLPTGATPTVCPLNVGDAVIHLANTLHYAGPNDSDASRMAWVVQFGIRHTIPHRVR